MELQDIRHRILSRDLRVNAEYVRMADRYIEVPGGSNNNNYANVDLIVDVQVGALFQRICSIRCSSQTPLYFLWNLPAKHAISRFSYWLIGMETRSLSWAAVVPSKVVTRRSSKKPP
jgi:hypothetical protein